MVSTPFASRGNRLIAFQGGDINVTDDENDTPLYTVENIDTARYLVEHGAVVDRRNDEGVSVSKCIAFLRVRHFHRTKEQLTSL